MKDEIASYKTELFNRNIIASEITLFRFHVLFLIQKNLYFIYRFYKNYWLHLNIFIKYHKVLLTIIFKINRKFYK